MPIQNDEEYEAVLGRIRKAVEFIASPLTNADDKNRYMKKYDELVEEVRAYRRIECHGYDYLNDGTGNAHNEPKQAVSPPEPVNTPPEQKTPEKTHTDVTSALSALSAFLDDD